MRLTESNQIASNLVGPESTSLIYMLNLLSFHQRQSGVTTLMSLRWRLDLVRLASPVLAVIRSPEYE